MGTRVVTPTCERCGLPRLDTEPDRVVCEKCWLDTLAQRPGRDTLACILQPDRTPRPCLACGLHTTERAGGRVQHMGCPLQQREDPT